MILLFCFLFSLISIFLPFIFLPYFPFYSLTMSAFLDIAFGCITSLRFIQRHENGLLLNCSDYTLFRNLHRNKMLPYKGRAMLEANHVLSHQNILKSSLLASLLLLLMW
jgi:hypothetical protein